MGWAAPRSTSCCCSRSSGGRRCPARCSRPRRVVAPALGDGAAVGTAAPRRIAVRARTPHVASVVLVPGRRACAPTDVGAHRGRRHRRRPPPVLRRRSRSSRSRTTRRSPSIAARSRRPRTSSGLSERMIDVAAEYARQREQYGRPIGVYQAVKHLLADALLKVEFAKPAVYRAAWSMADRRTDTRPRRLDGEGASPATPPTARAAARCRCTAPSATRGRPTCSSG